MIPFNISYTIGCIDNFGCIENLSYLLYPMIKQEALKWNCYKKKEVLALVNDYFKVNPCRSEKSMRINMVNKLYELRNLHAHKALPNSVLGKAWKHYLIQWNSLVSK